MAPGRAPESLRGVYEAEATQQCLHRRNGNILRLRPPFTSGTRGALTAAPFLWRLYALLIGKLGFEAPGRPWKLQVSPSTALIEAVVRDVSATCTMGRVPARGEPYF